MNATAKWNEGEFMYSVHLLHSSLPPHLESIVLYCMKFEESKSNYDYRTTLCSLHYSKGDVI